MIWRTCIHVSHKHGGGQSFSEEKCVFWQMWSSLYHKTRLKIYEKNPGIKTKHDVKSLSWNAILVGDSLGWCFILQWDDSSGRSQQRSYTEFDTGWTGKQDSIIEIKFSYFFYLSMPNFFWNYQIKTYFLGFIGASRRNK